MYWMNKHEDCMAFFGMYKPNYQMEKLINVSWAIEEAKSSFHNFSVKILWSLNAQVFHESMTQCTIEY